MFVHGYNCSFDDAAFRTAQIAHDLSFSGAPIFYSWPSSASVPKYSVDEQQAEWSQTNLTNFLDAFFDRIDAEQIHLIAHSMSNRALTRAIAGVLERRPGLSARIREIGLTPPDIDAEVFRRDIAP